MTKTRGAARHLAQEPVPDVGRAQQVVQHRERPAADDVRAAAMRSKSRDHSPGRDRRPRTACSLSAAAAATSSRPGAIIRSPFRAHACAVPVPPSALPVVPVGLCPAARGPKSNTVGV